MSGVHPTIMASLSPFLGAMNSAPTAPAPKRPKGQVEYHYHTDCDVPLICHLDYFKGQRETRIDPAIPASMSLTAAYVNGADVLCLLDPRIISLCEERALISHLEE